jgi:hypothetical protein
MESCSQNNRIFLRIIEILNYFSELNQTINKLE